MTTCASCNQTILWGGTRQGELRFCSDTCLAAGAVRVDMEKIPDAIVAQRVREIHNGRCPECSGPGPVDIHFSYRVWSGIFLTNWYPRATLCCRRCGNKGRVKDALFTLVLGWWGVPWGLIITPIYIGRNIMGLMRKDESATPSDDLQHYVRYQLAAAEGAPDVSSHFIPRESPGNVMTHLIPRRGIPAGGVAHRSLMPNKLALRALPPGRRARGLGQVITFPGDQQPVVKRRRRTEGGEAPRWQGATTENTGSM